VEKIVWVVTPPCSRCRPTADFNRRSSCFGCDKLRDARKAEKTNAPRLRGAERDSRIISMRDCGMSLGKIALSLGVPRSTVQSVLARAKGKSPA
jgi:DNA-binding NarL/FixJ family response regulator